MTALRTEPTRVEIEGRHIQCLMCSKEQFHKRRSHLDTSLAAGMKPDWHESQATCLVCDHCGFLHWFIQK